MLSTIYVKLLSEQSYLSLFFSYFILFCLFLFNLNLYQQPRQTAQIAIIFKYSLLFVVGIEIFYRMNGVF